MFRILTFAPLETNATTVSRENVRCNADVPIVILMVDVSTSRYRQQLDYGGSVRMTGFIARPIVSGVLQSSTSTFVHFIDRWMKTENLFDNLRQSARRCLHKGRFGVSLSTFWVRPCLNQITHKLQISILGRSPECFSECTRAVFPRTCLH